jgi:hypothetical protein
MTENLKIKIESIIKAVYDHLGVIDQSRIDRKIAGQFRAFAHEECKHIVLNDGTELDGRLMFIATDAEQKDCSLIMRDGHPYSSAKEAWIVLIITDDDTILTIERLDVFWPDGYEDGREVIRENGEWSVIAVEEIDGLWETLY